VLLLTLQRGGKTAQVDKVLGGEMEEFIEAEKTL